MAIATSAAAAAPAQAQRAAAIGLADAVRVAGPMRVTAAQRPRVSSSSEAGDGGAKTAAKRQPAAAPTAPAPVPAPAPAPAAGPLLFNGEHLSDFPLLQEAPGAITEAPDPAGSGSVFQMTVDEGDVAPITPTENPRAQAVSPDLIEDGDEFWMATKFLIPQDFPDIPGWLALVGVYGAPYNGTGPWGIEVSNNRLQWMRNRTYGWDVPWSMPLVKGSWTTVLLHERFGTDGWVEMWINGQQVSFFGRETKLAMQTKDSSNGGGPNSVRISQYREAGMFETGTLYFGALKIGSSRESVGG
ncbi:MAG: heparin lyase I family protein [Solirubrobacterales bacterium]